MRGIKTAYLSFIYFVTALIPVIIYILFKFIFMRYTVWYALMFIVCVNLLLSIEVERQLNKVATRYDETIKINVREIEQVNIEIIELILILSIIITIFSTKEIIGLTILAYFISIKSSKHLPNIVLFFKGYTAYHLKNHRGVIFSKSRTLKNRVDNIEVYVIGYNLFLEIEKEIW